MLIKATEKKRGKSNEKTEMDSTISEEYLT